MLFLAIMIYFVIRGVLEGMTFGKKIRPGIYHFLRLIESISVFVIALNTSSPKDLIGFMLIGAFAYEFALNIVQYDTPVNPEPFTYKILKYEILVTPARKARLMLLYLVIGIAMVML